MNVQSLLLLILVLLVAAIVAVRYVRRQRRTGGCGGCQCSSCSGCPGSQRTVCFLLPLLIASAMVSCGHGGRTQQQLQMLDTLVDTNPDSVLVILQQMTVDSLDRPDRMHAELLRGKAMNKAYVDFTTDSVMLQVVDYYDRHGNANQQMLSYYILGCAYRDMGSAPKALEAYFQATEKADTTASDFDYSTLIRIHGQIARIYEMMDLVSYQEEELTKARHLCSQYGDDIVAEALDTKRCQVLYVSGQYEKCLNLATHIYHNLMAKQDSVNAALACIYKVKTYCALAQYDSMKVYLDIYSQPFNTQSPEIRTIIGGAGIPYKHKGTYYLLTGKPDSALTNYRKSLDYPTKPIYSVHMMHGMAQSFSALHQPDSALKYIALYDSLSNLGFDESVAKTSIMAKELYDYSVEQKIAAQKAKEAATAQAHLLWAIVALAILLVLVLYVRYRHMQSQKEAVELRLRHQQAINALHAMQGQLDILVSQKRELETQLRQEAERSQALASDKAAIDRDIASQMEEIERQQRHIASLERLLGTAKEADASDQLPRSLIVSLFRQALSAKGYTIEDKHWDQLQSTICQLFPLFDQTVNGNGALSSTDYRVCMLVKAGFSPSDIDYLMKRKHSYASNARKRLHAIVFGCPGTAEDFDRKIRFIK